MILHVAAELTNLSGIRRFVEESARSLSADERTAYDLSHAVDECVTNIIEHGYRGQPGAIEDEIVRAAETLRLFCVITRRHSIPPWCRCPI